MAKDTKLKPCAYCGSVDVIISHGTFFYSKVPMFRCLNCGAITSFNDPDADKAADKGDDSVAIELFNTRAKVM